MEGDRVQLWVSPFKRVIKLRRKGNPSPRIVGPFDIYSPLGEVAYNLTLPPSLSIVHPVFHVSMLLKYVSDESHLLSLNSLELDLDFSCEDEPITIFYRHVWRFRTKEISLVKVERKHHLVGEATWKKKIYMCARYPQLFKASSTFCWFIFRDKHGF